MTLQALLGLDLPIVQSPMAGVQRSALAIAVSNAGGLGSLPAALLEADALRRELEAIREATDRPFNVNFFAHPPPQARDEDEIRWRRALAPFARELGLDPERLSLGSALRTFDAEALAVLADFRPPVVSFHFGLPAEPLLAGVRALGAKILSTATTVEEARWLEARGVDAIIAQGLEAGGHRGIFLSDDLTTQSGTLSLVPQIVRAVRVPVVAAGGIADARGVAAALALGAAGAQVGTAYLLCPETTIGPAYRAALATPAAGHTAVTNVFTGRPARAIVNRFVRDLGPTSADAPPFPLALAATAALRAAAEARDSDAFSAFWCGQNATGCRAVPAAALTRALAKRV